MIVNLYDSNFTQNIYSVLGKKPLNVEYVHQRTQWDGVTVFTDEFINSDLVDQVQSTYKIGWLHEPQCLHPETYSRALDNLNKFDFILTYYQPFLEMEGFRFAPYGGIWIKRDHWGIQPKTKLVSMLYGSKYSTEGHRLRHKIANNLADKYPIDFYGYRGTPVDYGAATKRRVLSDYMFTIVTETCCEDNLFTEILLDCFAVGTVPIFWGCPNITKYFTDSGILMFNDAQDVEWLLNNISSDLHFEMLSGIGINYELCKQYEITEDWLYEHVLKDLE